MKRLAFSIGLAGLLVPMAACSDDDSTGDDSDGSATEDGGTSGGGDDGGGDDGGTDTGDDGGTDTGDDGTTGELGKAMIRVVHASPDAPAVDVYVEGLADPVITDLGYGDSSEYLEVDEGDYNFQIRAAGSPATDDPAFETGALALPADSKVTALAAGLLGSTEDEDKFRVLPLVEGFDAAGDGEAIVRIVHAGADAPTVDLDVGNDGSSEVTDFERFADTGEAGVALPSGTAIQIGVVADGSPVTAFTTPELPEGAELFVVATGQLADLPRQETGFSLLAVGPDGAIGLIPQNPTVFAFHAGSDAPAVDICVTDSPLLENVPFGAIGGVQVPPGSYTLDFYAAPSNGCEGDPATSQDTPALEAGQR